MVLFHAIHHQPSPGIKMDGLWLVQQEWLFWSVDRCWRLNEPSCPMLGCTDVWLWTWLVSLNYPRVCKFWVTFFFKLFYTLIKLLFFWNKMSDVILMWAESWLICSFPVPPIISSRGGTVTVVVNEAARLECEATGVPLPSLTWLKDGSPVASVSHGIQVLFDQPGFSLAPVSWSDCRSASFSLLGVIWRQGFVTKQCSGQWHGQIHMCGRQRWRRTKQRLWSESVW